MCRLNASRVGILLVVVVAALACAAAARAQAPEPEPIERTAARYAARLALMDLRLVASESPLTAADYMIATQVLEAAHRLAPDDQIILRHLIEASENAEDPGRVSRYTRELVRLDPDDSVAQLRLISSTIQANTVESRLAAYDRWLGPEGAAVDASVRSRLAFDAALLAREQGDARGFFKRLGQAVELDSTNKDAAALALSVYSAASDDPVGRFELMLAVLGADPLDAGLHQAIARHLAAQGAFRGADRFFKSLIEIRNRVGPEMTADEQVEFNISQWMIGGPRLIVQALNDTQANERERRRQAIAIAQAEEKPVDELDKPEAVLLPINAEWLRLAGAVALADDQLIVGAMDEFLRSAQAEWNAIAGPGEEPQAAPSPENVERLRGLLEESVFARLLANKDLDEVTKDMDALRAQLGPDRDRYENLEAWFLFRTGRTEAAERWFRDHAANKPLAAVGLGMLLEERGEKAGAISTYEALARAEAGTIPGAFASTRYAALAGSPLPMTETAKKLEDLAAGVPEWIEIFIESPRRIFAVEAQVENEVIGTLDPARLRITVRNLGFAPLGVGPESPINTRFLIAPDVQIQTTKVPTVGFLNVVSLDRRLRLDRQGSFTAVVDAELPHLSTLLEEAGGQMSRVRYGILQGFVSTSEGFYSEGPFCVATDAGPLLRRVPVKSTLAIASLIGLVERGAVRDIAEAIIAVNGALGNPGTSLTIDDLNKFYTAVANRLPTLKPAEQMLVVSVVPPVARLSVVAPVDAAVRSLADAGVRALFLAMRTSKADDPALSDAITVGNAELASLAGLVKQRLAAGSISYATEVPPPPAAPDDGALSPPSK